MSLQWRVEWQHVSAIAYPEYYASDNPVVVPSEVPDMYWTSVHREGSEDTIKSQYAGLKALVEEHQLVRNVTLWNAPAVTQVTWQRAE